MKLLTKEIAKRLPALYSTESIKLEDKTVQVKFFNPVGAATWWIFEGEEQEDGDWLLFGMADLGMGCQELGYVSLNELKGIRLRFGLSIERDLHFGTPQWKDVA